jgi:Mrp family chromosome partitioning ATPase
VPFVVVITGPPGAGKSSVLTALENALADDGIRHAAIETEALVWAHPDPTPEQRLRHVAALCALYRESGYDLLLFADPIETDVELHELLDAASADGHALVRLDADERTLRERIVDREPAGWSGLAGLLERSSAIKARMAALPVAHLVIDTDAHDASACAALIRSVWPDVLEAQPDR